jgi:hypothetical protein
MDELEKDCNWMISHPVTFLFFALFRFNGTYRLFFAFFLCLVNPGVGVFV